MATRMFKITGYKHSDELIYPDWDKAHEFPDRKLIHESATEFEGEFESMDEASLWLLTYHPEYYMGHGIHALDGSNDFKCTCVPGALYSAYRTTNDSEVLLKEYEHLVKEVHFNDGPEIVSESDYSDWEDYDDDDEMYNDGRYEDYMGSHESYFEGDSDFNKKNYDDEYYASLAPGCIFDSAGEPILI